MYIIIFYFQMNTFYPFIILILLFQISCGSERNEGTANSSGRIPEFIGNLQFLAENDDTISTIDIALADDDESRALGLMDVRSLKQDGGMLFVFPGEQRQNFWMANTPLPLDLIFVNSRLEIVHIHHNARPFSQQGIDSNYPAMYVVEVNAGYAIQYDLQAGHKISFNY